MTRPAAVRAAHFLAEAKLRAAHWQGESFLRALIKDATADRPKLSPSVGDPARLRSSVGGQEVAPPWPLNEIGGAA